MAGLTALVPTSGLSPPAQGLQGVASGAIASDYQRLRVESVCVRLGLTSLAYLWHQPQVRLLLALISSGCQKSWMSACVPPHVCNLSSKY